MSRGPSHGDVVVLVADRRAAIDRAGARVRAILSIDLRRMRGVAVLRLLSAGPVAPVVAQALQQPQRFGRGDGGTEPWREAQHHQC